MAEKQLVASGWANPQYVPQLWIKYRMQKHQLLALWDQQDGRCAGCQGRLAHPFMKRLEMGLKFHVSWDAERKEVRGLFCASCNHRTRRGER